MTCWKGENKPKKRPGFAHLNKEIIQKQTSLLLLKERTCSSLGKNLHQSNSKSQKMNLLCWEFVEIFQFQFIWVLFQEFCLIQLSLNWMDILIEQINVSKSLLNGKNWFRFARRDWERERESCKRWWSGCMELLRRRNLIDEQMLVLFSRNASNVLIVH